MNDDRASTTSGRVHLRTLERPPRDPAGHVDVDALVRRCGPADLLESADRHGWSYVVPHAGPVLRDDGRRSVLVVDGVEHDLGTDPFAALETLCARHGITPTADAPDPDAPALSGGLVGAFGYDLARRVERLPRRTRTDRDQLHLHLRLVELVVAVSPDRSRAMVVGRDLGLGRELPARAAALADRAQAAGPPPPAPPDPAPGPVVSSLSRDAHLAAVERVLAHIAAGDVFQVNLAQRLTAPWRGDAHQLYRALRRESPAPFGAVLPEVGIASVSPETFLAVDGTTVTTRPIKGTRPRVADPALDAALADDLVTSVKDRAENVMVVDLERNDLGRVCRPGTVRVPQLTALESHPTVWHLVSTVVGELDPGVGYGGLLRATFPCGSITGAPKVAAMTLIEQLERVRRGWYCGAVGFLSPGAARLSVAIRTATLRPDGRVDFGAGGGIVADSDPVAEREESFDKAAAFLRAVGASGAPVPAGVDREEEFA